MSAGPSGPWKFKFSKPKGNCTKTLQAGRRYNCRGIWTDLIPCTTSAKCARIFYSRTSDTVVYLQRTHAATNEFFENLICETDTMRWPVTLDRTAVHDLHERPVLRLYPNPHRGPFTLEYPPSHQPAAYRILNLAGQVCQEGLIADAHLGRTTLHLDSPWPSGIYLLEFKGPLGRNSVRFLKTDD